MALVFERNPLERLKFVFQTGGRNIKVTQVVTGIESFVFGAIVFNQLKLTKKGKVMVFGEDDTFRGYILRDELDLPKKYLPDPEDVNTVFSDWYTERP